MSMKQGIGSLLDRFVLLEVAVLIFSGPVALVAILALPALPGVGSG